MYYIIDENGQPIMPTGKPKKKLKKLEKNKEKQTENIWYNENRREEKWHPIRDY